MNKLYCIRFTLKNGYVISVYNTFSGDSIKQKIKNNPQWKFVLIESNNIHDIYIAS